LIRQSIKPLIYDYPPQRRNERKVEINHFIDKTLCVLCAFAVSNRF